MNYCLYIISNIKISRVVKDLKMDDRIIKYYLLCTVRIGSKAHIVNEIPDKKLSIVFTKKEIGLFLRKQGNQWIAKDIVVGGHQTNNQAHDRLPVIIV